MKMHLATGAGGELGTGAFGGARFIEYVTVEFGDLVGADHQGMALACGGGLGFGDSQAQGPGCRRFVRPWCFIGARRALFENRYQSA